MHLIRPGHCPECDYDLSGLELGPRDPCPECGSTLRYGDLSNAKPILGNWGCLALGIGLVALAAPALLLLGLLVSALGG